MNDLFKPDDTRDALRKIGGLLFGLGALMIYMRKGGIFASQNDARWAAFPLFVVVGAPAAYLYASLLTRPRTGELRPWQAVHSVFGLILVPIALRQFVVVLGGSPGASMNTFWIFGVTAALGFYAGAVVGVRVQLLLGSIASIIAWSALWSALLTDGISAHFGVWRSFCSPGGSICGATTRVEMRG
jgi:hypothetical protein